MVWVLLAIRECTLHTNSTGRPCSVVSYDSIEVIKEQWLDTNFHSPWDNRTEVIMSDMIFVDVLVMLTLV